MFFAALGLGVRSPSTTAANITRLGIAIVEERHASWGDGG
jgi:hypothetical protein